MSLLNGLRVLAGRVRAEHIRKLNLSYELANYHVDRALDAAVDGDWDDCLDQLYRASTAGGQEYRELYCWLAGQMDRKPEEKRFGWIVPCWSAELNTATAG